MGLEWGVGLVTEIAEAERISKRYVSRILRLALLAPDPVEAILDGPRQLDGITLPELLAPFSVEWEGQHSANALAEGASDGNSGTFAQ